MKLILLVFAFVLFVVAAIPYPPAQPYTVRLIAAGLAFYAAADLFG